VFELVSIAVPVVALSLLVVPTMMPAMFVAVFGLVLVALLAIV
jgi:hypothetical protein